MDYADRLSLLKILQPHEHADKETVKGFIREAERRFLYKAAKPTIVIRPLKEGKDWDWLLEYPEDKEWKKEKDYEHGIYWQERGKMALNVLLGRGGQSMDAYVKTQMRIMLDNFAKRTRVIPFRAGQAVIATASHVVGGFVGYEVLPHGENPYEPLLCLYELGYVLRRVKTDDLNEWRVGFIEEKA